MKPPGHAVVSLTIGGILWAITKSPYAMLSASLTGVLIDLDHLADFYRWHVKGDHTRVWFFLHSYELMIPALLAGYFSGWDPVILGISAAFLGHLICDQIFNPVMPFFYFFTYRASKGFRFSELIKSDWEEIEQDLLEMPGARTLVGFLKGKGGPK